MKSIQQNPSNRDVPVVIGNLMLGRCFTLAKVPFIGITSRNDLRITYSRYCIQGAQMPNPEQNPEEAFAWLQNLVTQIGEGHPLFCSNDAHLKMMLNHWDAMREMFRFVTVDKTMLENILNKEKFIQFAQNENFPLPQTFTETELNDIKSITFPVIVKPIIRIHWFNSRAVKKYGGKKYKGILVHNPEQLEDVIHLLNEEKLQFVVQQFIPGDESNILSFHSFFTEDSKPLGYFVGRKIRTYPVDYGESCALRLTDYPGIVEMSLNLLERINFKGPIKIDYKLDPRDGKLYLLELNPTRYNMWHYLGARGGVNLPHLAYRYITEKRVSAVVNQWDRKVVWFNFFNDVQAFWELKNQGRLSFWQWLKTYQGKRVYKTLAFDDLPPVVYGFRMTLKGGFRRLKRLFKRS